METQYIKETKIIEQSEFEKEREILENIRRVKKELETSRRNFEYAKSNDLVDYYIYQIKAYQAKLDYLIKVAKKKGIMVKKV